LSITAIVRGKCFLGARIEEGNERARGLKGYRKGTRQGDLARMGEGISRKKIVRKPARPSRKSPGKELSREAAHEELRPSVGEKKLFHYEGKKKLFALHPRRRGWKGGIRSGG